MFFYLYIPGIPIRFCHSFTDSIITITKIHAIPTRSIVVMTVPSHNTEKSVAETGSTLEIMLARTGPMSCTPCRNNKNDIIVPIKTIAATANIPWKPRCTGIVHTLTIQLYTTPQISMP